MREENSLEEEVAARLEDHGLTVERRPDGSPALVATASTANGPVTLAVETTSLPRTTADRPPATIVAQPYISTRRGRALRAYDVPYVDSVGNMWLSLPGFHIEVEGRARPEGWSSRPVDVDRLSRPSSLKIIFALLTQPALVRLTVRQLAGACGTSIGAAQATLADLAAGGFVSGAVPGRRLHRTGKLADRWVAQFPARLLPKLDRLTLRGPEPSWWFRRLDDPALADVSIGGEAACELLGYPLRSAETLLYGAPPWGEARKAGRLSGAGGAAGVVLRERFWPADSDQPGRTTPALLVYADLVGTDEPRLLRMAEQMRESDVDLRRLWAS